MTELAERRKELLDSMMREAVYEGAVAVLKEHGLNGTTMDRVAAAAGMAKGSLYNHFRNKQELLEFVHDRAVAPMQEALEDIVKNRLCAAEKLASISRLWREYLVKHHAVFEFLINDHAAKRLLRDTEQTTRASGIKQIATIIEQGIEEGAFRPVDATAAAEMFVSASIGMVEHEFAAGITRPVDKAVDVLMGVFLHGLCAAEGDCQG
ncbi:MAG: TetR/AcrR family transcriptional regulator [Planctomycetota bacterium]